VQHTAAGEAPPPPPGGPSAAQRRWRKVLYERQPYDDTYTGEGFLEELVVNATVPQRDYAAVVWSALVVDQQLASVAAVGSASYHLHQARCRCRHLPPSRLCDGRQPSHREPSTPILLCC
jgi:hypothetical protein